MTGDNPINNGYYVDSFPAAGLRQVFRHITGNADDGKSIFLHSDHGNHHRVIGEKQAVANIMYSTQETPVELNGDVDVQKALSQEVCSPSSPAFPSCHLCT